MTRMEFSGEDVVVIDYATLTVSSTAVGLASGSPALPGNAKRMFITIETDAVRWRADGTDPTSSEGHPIVKDDSISFTGANYRHLLENIKFIRVTNDAKIDITYFK